MKQFFATISMQPAKSLEKLDYVLDGAPDTKCMPASFPSIPMLESNLSSDDEYELYLIYTKDDEGRYKHCYDTFYKELSELSERMGFGIKVTAEVQVPHEESRSKHIGFFRDVCKLFKPETDVYMDVTYGTKVTSISCFASLTYAEDVLNCDIRSIVYGKYDHSGSGKGELFDIRALYELSGLIHSASAMPGIDVDKMLDMFGGDE